MTEEKINSLLDKGFKRWTKGNTDRLYISASQLGLVCEHYKTGNISYAEFRGEMISNCKARKMLAAKTFIDVKTGKAYSDDRTLKDAVTEMINE